jgi:hypothetical protein
MRLHGQFAQRHFGTFEGFALRPEGGVTQTWASVFAEIGAGATITEAACTGSWAALTTRARTPITRPRITATLSTSRHFCALLARTVIATHGHHRLGRFDHNSRRLVSRRGCIGVLFMLGATSFGAVCSRDGFRTGWIGLGRVRRRRIGCRQLCTGMSGRSGLLGLCLQGLTAQGRVQSGHGCADFDRIATGIGGIQGF